MQASVAPVCFHVFVGGFVFGDDFLKIEDVCSKIATVQNCNVVILLLSIQLRLIII